MTHSKFIAVLIGLSLCVAGSFYVVASGRDHAEQAPGSGDWVLPSVNPSHPSHEAAAKVALVDPAIEPCQALGPAAPYAIWGVDSAAGNGCGEVGWDSRGCIPWQEFAQGEYVGHSRTAHVPEYRLRVGDQLAVFYRRTREELSRPYELQVGDVIRIESLTAAGAAGAGQRGQNVTPTETDLTRELVIQPDGTISLPLLGQVRATRRTVATFRDELEEQYKKYFRVPSMTVTPVKVNTKLEDLMETVDSRSGILGGFQVNVVVTPAGAIQLPAIGSVFVQSLTMAEAKQEIDARYEADIPGVEVTLDLVKRAQRFIFVLGEVNNPGQYELQGPTTALGALAFAGGQKLGSNLRQVVVFRRGEDWRLMATMLDLRGAVYAKRPVPADDIWLNDSDIVLVPKSPIQVADEFIEQVFTRGLYSVVPREVIWNLNFADSSSL